MLRTGRPGWLVSGSLLACLAVVVAFAFFSRGKMSESEGVKAFGGDTPVSERDVQLVQSYGYLLTTTVGAHVQVVHVAGDKVWAAFFPGVELGSDTEVVKSHAMIVVRSTTDVPQTRHAAPGSEPTKIAVVGLVIDSVTGLIVERMSAPASAVDKADDLTKLGEPSDVVVENVDPPKAE